MTKFCTVVWGLIEFVWGQNSMTPSLNSTIFYPHNARSII